MAGEDEDFGSAHITIDLDDTGVVTDARALGERIQAALNRATRGIANKIKNDLQNALRGVKVQIQVDPDLRRFDSALLTGLSHIDAIEIPVVPDLRRFDSMLLTRLGHIDAIEIPVVPDLRRFDSALLTGLRSIDSLNIPVAPDVSDFMARLRAALAGEEIAIRVVPDFGDFDDRVRAHRAPDVNVTADVDTGRLGRSLAGLGGIAGRVGSQLAGLLKLGAVGIAAAGAAQGVGALLAALAPAGGIIAAIPAAIAGAAAAMGTLKLATLGVGDALEAAVQSDAKDFTEAVKNLAPAARQAVTAVHQLQPQLKRLQQSVQQSFFRQFAGDVTASIKNLLPLRTQLSGLAGEFGKAASQGLKFAASKEALAPLRTIIQSTTQAASGLQVVVQPLAKGFLDVAAAVAQAFGGQVGGTIAQLGAQLGTFLSGFAASGRAVEVVRTAVGVFQQLGSIAANVGAIIANVFRAADGAGGGLLNNLQEITGSFREFVASAAGQQAIGNLFGTVATIAAQLGPNLGALVTQIGAIAPALSPVFTALGPALVGVIDSLGPALAAIAPSLTTVAQALAAGLAQIDLAPLGESIAQVLTALSPLLPLAGQLVNVLAQALAPVLSTLAAAFGPIIEELVGALMPVLPPLTSAFVQLATSMAPIAAGIGDALAGVIARLAPLLPSLATSFGQLALALAPIAESLGQAVVDQLSALEPVLPQIAGAATELVAALVPLVGQIVDALLPVLPDLVGVFLQLTTAVLPVVPPVLQLATALAPLADLVIQLAAPLLQIGLGFQTWLAAKVAIPIIQGIATALGGLITGLTSVVTFITNLPSMIVSGLSMLGGLISTAFTSVVGFFQRLPGMILAALAALPGLLAQAFHLALVATGIAIGTGIGALILLFTRVPVMIYNGLASLGGFLVSRFSAALSAAASATSSGASTVAAFFQALPGRIAGFLAGLPARLGGIFRSAGSSMLGAARSAGSQVLGFFQALPGRIGSAMSSAGSVLAGVGMDLVRGLIGGIRSMAGAAADAARDVVGSAISAAKSVLKIGSPSKVFIEIGKWTGQGFVIGLTGTVDQIKQTTEKIAKLITQAFKGKNTRLDDRLLAVIADGNKRLVTLANQRDALAKRIADANKFATDTAASALQSFSLQNLTQGGDITREGLLGGLQDAVSQVKNFTAQIDALKRRGLRSDLLSQVIGLGPAQGAELASVLASQSSTTIAEINALQRQLVTASNALGQHAADSLFDAGKQASKGFLAGLKGQQKDIEKLMLDIAKAMQTSIRKALGIHSPSTVFRKIGDLTGLGLHVGIVGRLKDVTAAVRAQARGMADAVSGQLAALNTVVPGPVVQPTLGTLSGAGQPAGGRAGLAGGMTTVSNVGGATTNFNITVQAANDPEQTARAVIRQIATANLT
ncbi:hypothetical protein AQJ30_15400 [Streptomyces longwoodensis]|uniref:Phage tail protein n=1 Tax=Streptomyces longwoodensis TaxID=68231 RepID=A0A101QXB9_9ACTN|nr:hypothetical protein [Streptomyces longwoodensis]KUN37668.1 hypothetical protein AQJ30_15400 [Streptomyces longwoodensis]